MSLGYLTADRKLVALKPLTVDIAAVNGMPQVALRGAEFASMATGRAMRAAQQNFRFPIADGVGGSSRSTRGGKPARLAAVLKDKQFSAFEETESGLLRILYRELVVRFHAGTTRKRRDAFISKFGLSLRREHASVANQVVIFDEKRSFDGNELVDIARRMADGEEVAFATPNFVSQYRRAATAAIPAAQWHLSQVNAKKAWALTRGKRSIVIAVLDDGVDVEHPDLKANIRRNADPSEPRDLCGRDFFIADTEADHFNPRPKQFRAPFEEMSGNDIHGTCCAGVAAARGPHALGLAPNCRLLPVKIFHGDNLASDAQVADAIRYASKFADVLSCSWSGPRSPDLAFALSDAASTGRKGRGSIVVCATGNESAKSVGYPASDRNCIGVGASTDKNKIAWYSNQGKQVWVVAPSNGGAKEIFTTDVSLPGRGFNTGAAALGGVDGLCANNFGGTSSATPLVAGLCGLMLSIKPSLTAAALREALAASATKIGAKSSYGPDGHSKTFGHGCIDALAALRAIGAK